MSQVATELAVVVMATSNSRYHLDDHTHPRRISIISEYVAPLTNEPTVAFDCLCCKRLFIEARENLVYRSVGKLEPDLISPIVETDF